MAATKTGLTAKPTTGVQQHTVQEYNKVIVTIDNNADELDEVRLIAETAQETANAATPIMQPETAEYVNRIYEAGGSISSSDATALDDFVVIGKKDGWFPLIKMFAPMLGVDLTSALVKFKIDASNVPLLENHDFIDSDYTKKDGITSTSSTNKFISTGFIPSENGLTSADIAFAYGISNNLYQNQTDGFLIGSTLETNGVFADNAGFYGGPVFIESPAGKAGRTTNLITSKGSLYAAYRNGTIVMLKEDQTPKTVVPNAEITLFKSERSGNPYFQRGSIAFVFFASGMTTREMGLSLNQALVNLYRKVGRLPSTGGFTSWFGDSITQGEGIGNAQLSFSTIVSTRLGTIEINFAQASGKLSDFQGNVVSGTYKFNEQFFQGINTCVLVLGTNDAGQDGPPEGTGNTDKLNTYYNDLGFIVSQIKEKGVRVILGGIPWRNLSSPNRDNAYRAKQIQVAAERDVLYVDLFNAFSDLENPNSYFQDGVHPNVAGHKVIADSIEAGIKGFIFRSPVLDFPSIAAGASSDLSISIPGARINMVVSLGLPANPQAGISFNAFVSANDTVVVRANNITGAAIDPASQKIKVTLTL